MRGAAFLSGVQDALVLDVGGTTADIGAIAGGFPRASAVAATFAEHDVSIETVRQRPGAPGESGDDEAAGATLVVVTHRAPDAALSATVEALGALDTVREVVSVMRVEGE